MLSGWNRRNHITSQLCHWEKCKWAEISQNEMSNYAICWINQFTRSFHHLSLTVSSKGDKKPSHSVLKLRKSVSRTSSSSSFSAIKLIVLFRTLTNSFHKTQTKQIHYQYSTQTFSILLFYCAIWSSLDMDIWFWTFSSSYQSKVDFRCLLTTYSHLKLSLLQLSRSRE